MARAQRNAYGAEVEVGAVLDEQLADLRLIKATHDTGENTGNDENGGVLVEGIIVNSGA